MRPPAHPRGRHDHDHDQEYEYEDGAEDDGEEEPEPRGAVPSPTEEVRALHQSLRTLRAERARQSQATEALRMQLEVKERFCKEIIAMGLHRLAAVEDAPVKEAKQVKATVARQFQDFKTSVVGHLEELHRQSSDVLRHVRVLEEAKETPPEGKARPAATPSGDSDIVREVAGPREADLSPRAAAPARAAGRGGSGAAAVPQTIEVERIVERLVPVERIVERVVEVPVERIVDRVVPVERVVEVAVPTETIVERVVEIPVERVVTVPVERVVTVPVERIVEVPVYKDRVVREVVEVPVDREVPVPVPVPTLVEVRVPVDRLVERVVEVDRFVEPKVDEEARHKSDLLKRRVSEMLAEVNADAAPAVSQERRSSVDIHDRLATMLSSLKAQRDRSEALPRRGSLSSSEPP